MQLSRLEAHMICIQPVDSGLEGYYHPVGKQSLHDEGVPERDIHRTERLYGLRASHDPKWTQEALINLLDNAIKYSPFRQAISKYG